MFDFSKKTIPKEYLFLALFFFLGLVFISETIGLLDFWLDEAAVYIAIQNSFGELGSITAQYAQQFLHNFAVKTWTIIFGESPLAIRGFSAFCYFLLIFVMYKAGSYFFQSKKTGLLAAFLLTTNYFAIWYAIEVKTYTLAALLGLLSFYFFIRSAHQASKKNYFLYFLFSGLGFYAHPWLLLTFGSQILSTLVFRKHFSKVFSLIFLQGLIFLTSLPFLFLTLKQGSLGVNSYAGTVGWSVILESFAYLSFGASWQYLAITLIALLFLLSRNEKIKNFFIEKKAFIPTPAEKPWPSYSQKEKQINIALLFYLFVPLILSAGVSHFTPAYVVGRYEMTVLPAFLLLLANLWFKIKENLWLFLIAGLLLYTSFNSLVAYRKNIDSFKSTDKTVIESLYLKAKKGDYLITTDLSWATAYYFLQTSQQEEKFHLVAYPEQISQQAVWNNQTEMNRPENRERYQKEAGLLLEKIKNDPSAKQIFVLYRAGFPVNELLKEQLDQNFELIEEDYLETPREPSWYDHVLIYKKN